MKKYNKIGLLCALVLIVFIGITVNRIEDKIIYTQEELDFINQNSDTVFLVGYFPAERRFAEKLSKRIKEDTSLNLQVYDTSWNDSLKELEMGNLPIVMNMNRTERREEYALFTESLMPIPCGIYSSTHNPILSFADLNGKTIGVEKNVALLDKFTSTYPNLMYELAIFDSFEDTRMAFAKGEIDCFISTKKYDRSEINLQFFEIESISKNTNRIGVSKEYPILHSILDKEVKRLKQEKFDQLILDIISFELEKGLVEFTRSELQYLDEREELVFGLPNEYFLYANNSEGKLSGIIPQILDRIGFICDKRISYRFDSIKNLRLREDIDFYIDNSITKDLTTRGLLREDVLAVGSIETKEIREVYELASYKVGVFGIPNYVENLREEMPKIIAKEYRDIELAKRDITNGKIDYLIIPDIFYNNNYPIEDLEIRGQLGRIDSKFMSSSRDCIEIINKCLLITDVQQVVHNELRSEDNIANTYTHVFILAGIIALGVVGRKLYIYLYNSYYRDNELCLYDVKHLNKRLTKYNYIALLEIENARDIAFYYGSTLYQSYMRAFLELVHNICEKDRLIYLSADKYLIVSDNDALIQEINNALLRDIVVRNICLSYKVNMGYIDINDNLDSLLTKLHIAIGISKEKSRLTYFTESLEKRHKNRFNRVEMMKSIINNESVDLRYEPIIDRSNSVIGTYVIPQAEGISHRTLYKVADSMNLLTVLDRQVLEKAIQGQQDSNIFINISTGTLMANGFYPWLNSLIKGSNIHVYLVVNSDFLENVDTIFKDNRISYVLGGFGRSLDRQIMVKCLPEIEYIFIDSELLMDTEINGELIDFIDDFADRYDKRLISNKEFEDSNYYI